MPIHIPKTAFSRVGRLVGSRFGAEIASNGAFIGSVLLAEAVAPHKMSDVKSFVAKHIVRPHLSYFDGAADAFPALEGSHNAEQRKMMDEDERADLIASAIVDYGIKFSASFAAKALSMKLLDRVAGLPPLPRQVFYKDPHVVSTAGDHSVQVGAFLLLNTFGKSLNEDMQKSFSGFLEKKFNVSPQTAESIARDTVNFQLVNLLGFGVGTAMLDKRYRDLFAKMDVHGTLHK